MYYYLCGRSISQTISLKFARPHKELAVFKSTLIPLSLQANARQKGKRMFGRMKAKPLLTLESSAPDPAIAALVAITENAQPVGWIEFPASILLCVSVQGDPESGAF